MTIDAIRQISIPQVPAPAAKPAAGEAGGFESALREAVQTVEHQRQAAAGSVERFLSGEGEELHQTALSVQRAELSFDLFLQVRNKAVQAYQEVMRMQV